MSLMHYLDYYKLTMGNLIYDAEPEAPVTFTLKNRGDNSLIENFDPIELQVRLAMLGVRPFTRGDLAWMSTREFANRDYVFDNKYIDYLWGELKLPEVEVGEKDGELTVSTTGDWPAVSLWETVIMATVNELHYRNQPSTVFTEGHNILTEKIKLLREHPEIKFADFGTRRRFSLAWHRQVIERLVTELPGQFVGTSNPGFARDFEIAPIGTYAHEMPMVYAAMAEAEGNNPLIGQRRMLQDWEDMYGPNLLIALTDTFGSGFFFNTFTEDQARKWSGFRHDSGDPLEFAFDVIDFFNSFGIDPRTKTIVFSDGLNLNSIIGLHNILHDKINVQFGWGTGLTNDLGVKPNNFVVKATKAYNVGTVKLSDVATKHTGSPEQIKKYLDLRTRALTPVS